MKDWDAEVLFYDPLPNFRYDSDERKRAYALLGGETLVIIKSIAAYLDGKMESINGVLETINGSVDVRIIVDPDVIIIEQYFYPPKIARKLIMNEELFADSDDDPESILSDDEKAQKETIRFTLIRFKRFSVSETKN